MTENININEGKQKALEAAITQIEKNYGRGSNVIKLSGFQGFGSEILLS